MTYTFFDVETTGLINKHLPLDHESQPRIVQIAAIETNGDGRTMNEINFIIKPAGWTIPEKLSELHGIYQADAEAYGIKIDGALSVMRRLISRSTKVIAHNIDFDAAMLMRESRCANWANLEITGFCTMRNLTNIIKLPPSQRMIDKGMGSKFKPPSLMEAYRHFHGKDFEGEAHNAMADVRACRDVYFKLKELGHVPGAPVAA